MTPPNDLAGLSIRPSDVMRGAKNAVLVDGVIHVSPAMWDLIRHSHGEELRKVLEAIRVIQTPGAIKLRRD